MKITAHQQGHLLEGLRVLFVDDNEINQEIASAQLNVLGCIVHIASSGQNAIELLVNTTFDLVLMDLNMPIMDGYQTTSLIRQNPKFSELPIIALSANFATGEKDRVILAGMNQWLTKPIKLDELLIALNSLQDSEDGRATGVTESEQTVSCKESTFDVEAALARLGRNRVFFWKMLLKFRDSYIDAGTQVRNLLAEGNNIEAQHLAHKVAGVAGNLSIIEVYEAALTLDKLLDTNDSMPELFIVGLEQSLRQFVMAMDQFEIMTQEVDDIPDELLPKNILELTPLLSELKRLLDEDETQAGRHLELLKPSLLERGLEVELTRLQKQVAGYDFDSAIETFLQITQQLNISLGDL